MSDHFSNNSKAKIEFIARITDADGKVIERKVSASEGFKSSDDFELSTREGFLTDFDALEKAALEARNKAAAEISSDFLELTSKKTSPGRMPKINLRGIRNRTLSFFVFWRAGPETETERTDPVTFFYRSNGLFLYKT